jgi:DNA polymerase-3 subunit epsilon
MKIREIALDTETTGLDPASGHRIIEIGCVEMVNKIRTGNNFHHYLNPQRDIPYEAQKVHGISNEKVKDSPLFSEIAGDFLKFIEDSTLIIHNAEFDMKFINSEFQKIGFATIPMDRTIDTVKIARKKFPGSPANLDALCKRFGIDLSKRTKHGALLDAELLADIYLELSGGRQEAIIFHNDENILQEKKIVRKFREARIFVNTEQELAAHDELIDKMKDALWKKNS